MRTLRIAVAASAAVHAAAVAWFASRTAPVERPAQPAAPAPIEIVSVPRAEAAQPIAAMDVALVEIPPEAAAMPGPPSAPSDAAPRPQRGDAAPGRSEISTSAAATTEAGSAATTAPGRTSSLLAMRGPGAADLALSGDRWAAIDRAPPPLPEQVRRTGVLHEAGGGSYKADLNGVRAKVSPDGSVKLTDSPNLHAHVALPRAKDLGNAVTRWYRSDKGPYGKEGDTSAGELIQVGPGAAVPDPVTGEVDHPEPTLVVPVLGGGFDTTDWLMRRHGQDPYAAKKLKFLDATRDERVQLGRQHRAAQLVRSPQLMQKNLDALWASTADLAARKRALFELWDECAETGDPEVVAGGQAARRMVIGFIRARLPAGSTDAYTPGELAAFARARQSKAPFEPYD